MMRTIRWRSSVDAQLISVAIFLGLFVMMAYLMRFSIERDSTISYFFLMSVSLSSGLIWKSSCRPSLRSQNVCFCLLRVILISKSFVRVRTSHAARYFAPFFMLSTAFGVSSSFFIQSFVQIESIVDPPHPIFRVLSTLFSGRWSFAFGRASLWVNSAKSMFVDISDILTF